MRLNEIFMPVARDRAASTIRALRTIGTCREPESLRRRGLFVAEGRLVVRRLLDLAGGHRVSRCSLNDASFWPASSIAWRTARSLPVYVCSTDELAAIVGFNLHRGCLALAERPADRRCRRCDRAC